MRILTAVLALAFVLAPVLAVAQEVSPITNEPQADYSRPESPGLESCFDYYRFGSVPVVLTSDTVRVAQGANLNLVGTITNENSYPMQDLTVYGKIFYKKNFEKNSFGPDIVDWFVIADGVRLDAGEVREISSSWKVPANLEPGDYQVAAYVVEQDRFNMFGLTFTNDVVGSLLNFSVAGENLGAVRFDNTKTVVNSIPLHAAIFSPRTPVSSEGTPVAAVINNTSLLPYEGTLHWKLYFWDAVQEKNLILEKTERVSLQPGASTTVTYTVTDTSQSVYFILGELVSDTNGHAKSILQIRYVLSKAEGNRPRIGFVGTSAYPTDGAAKAFACIHSTGTRAAESSRLELSARPLDPWSWIRNLGRLGSRTWEGAVPGQMSALAMELPSADRYAVTARLYQNGELVDQVTATYGCNQGGDCGKSIVANLAVTLVALLLAGITLYSLRRERNRIVTQPTV